MSGGSTIERVRFFSSEEYDRRLAGVRDRMAAQGLDLLLVYHPENVTHVSGYQSIGYSSYLCLAIPQTGSMMLYVREMERGCASYYAWVDDVVSYSDHEEPVETLCRALDERGLVGGRIGVEMDAPFVGAKQMWQLTERLKAAEVVDSSGTVEQLRRVKSAEEIEYIRRGCRATEAGILAAVDAVQPGATENDVAAAMFAATVKAGSTAMSSNPIVTSGPRSGIAHTTFDGRVIQAGDMVLLELGGCVNRYSGALMRTVAVGKVPAEAEKMAATCREALEAAIEAIAPGVTCGAADEACASVMRRAGYEANFRKRTGYSVGVSYAPDWGEGHIVSLRHGDPTPLEPGMVFHIPPALREYGRWAVGVSETVLVTADACEVLTHMQRDLFRKQLAMVSVRER